MPRPVSSSPQRAVLDVAERCQLSAAYPAAVAREHGERPFSEAFGECPSRRPAPPGLKPACDPKDAFGAPEGCKACRR